MHSRPAPTHVPDSRHATREDDARDGACATNGAGSEAGFTLIEVLIVVVVIGIVAAGTFSTFRSTEKAPQVRRGIDVARSLQRAVDEFRLDHDNRPPSPNKVGTTAGSDWAPTRGPLDPDGRPYMSKASFDSIDSQDVAICLAPDSAGATITSGGRVHGAPAALANCSSGAAGRRAQVVLHRVGSEGSWGYWIDVFSFHEPGAAWTAQDYRCSLAGGAFPPALFGKVVSTC